MGANVQTIYKYNSLWNIGVFGFLDMTLPSAGCTYVSQSPVGRILSASGKNLWGHKAWTI